MPSVVVSKKSKINISVRNQAGFIQPSATGAVTLNNMGAAAGSATALTGLTDVNLTSTPPVDGSTIIYNANTQKFDVTTSGSLSGNLDGGTF